MQHIEGVPITEYCNAKKLSLPSRLNLFLQVCDAIQHAHQKSLLHRDIKPENILVTEVDGKPLVKVIDFGLACSLSTASVDSESNSPPMVIGSPIWMSPEQAQSIKTSKHDRATIDTRSDIFSLGIVLYELLTNTTPITREVYSSSSVVEVLNMIVHQTCPLPTDRINSQPGLQDWIAEQTDSSLSRWVANLKSDLNWITLKTLKKDRNLRYDSVGALHDDLVRFSQSEPVSARPKSLNYVGTKFAKRNRALVAIAGLSVGFLVVLLMGALKFADLSRHAEQVAKEGRQNAIAERDRANAATLRLLDIIEKSNLSNPNTDRTEVVLNIPDQIRNEVIRQISKGPNEVGAAKHAGFFVALGKVEMGCGRFENAIDDFERALAIYATGPRSETRDRQATEILLAKANFEKGNFDRVCELIDSRYGSADGANELTTLSAAVLRNKVKIRKGRMQGVIPDLEKTIEKANMTLGPRHLVAIEATEALADAWFSRRWYRESARLFRQCHEYVSMDLGADSRKAIELEVKYWAAYVANHSVNSDYDALERLIERISSKFGNHHVFTFRLKSIYGRSLCYRGDRPGAAEAYISDLLEQLVRVDGENSIRVAAEKMNLAYILMKNDPVASRRVAEEAFTVFSSKLGETSLQAVEAKCQVARVLIFKAGSLFEAFAISDKYSDIALQEFGAQTLVTTELLEYKAMALGEAGNFKEAISILNRILKFSQLNGQNTVTTGEVLMRLGEAYSRKCDWGQAVAYLERSYEVRLALQGSENRDCQGTKMMLDWARQKLQEQL